MKCDLRGKVSLVTGAAQGIGLAIANRLADCGSRVVYSDVNLDGVSQAAARKNETASDKYHLTLRMDVTQAGEVESGVSEIVERCGRIDILINNAGVNTLQHRVPIDEFPREEWDRLLNVDLNGVFEVSRAVAPVMRRQRAGRIVNIGSVVGLIPFRHQCAFNAAKAGVIQLTKAMALELAPDGILVNALCPGSVMTDGTKQLFYGEDGKLHEKMQQMLDHVPIGRPAEVEEIAIGVLFLVDPENSYTTGHVLTIDGGWTCGYARDF